MTPVNFNAKDILAMGEDAIWTLDKQYPIDQVVIITFDDDKIDITGDIPSLIVSYYLWQILKDYPRTPLVSDYYVGNFTFNSSLTTTIMTAIARGIIETYAEEIDFDLLGSQIYRRINDFYNMIVSRLPAYVETVDARAYVDILYNDKIVNLREEVKKNPTSGNITQFYTDLRGIFNDKSFMPGNALAETMRAGLRPIGQIQQCVGVRGIVTDMDSSVFQGAIMSCFGEGIKKMSDFLIETRSATKALMFQIGPIRDTEYFNRRMQLLNETIRHVFKGDCGTKETLPWLVEPGDIKSLAGRYYVDETDGSLRVIDPSDFRTKSLVGKTIQLRSPTMCAWSHKGGVCQHCLGQLALTIPAGANIGHLSAYTIGEKITQTVLSTKHLDSSASIKEIQLEKKDLKYIRLNPNRNELIMFSDKTKELANRKNTEVKIMIPIESVGNLTQAMQVKDLSKLSIYKISRIERIGVVTCIGDEAETVEWVTVSGPSRLSSFTTPFLEHIRKVRYQQTDPKFIEVPLAGWDFSLPVLRLPQKQINMLDFMKSFSTMIECGPRERAKKDLDPSKPEDMAKYVRSVYDFANQHIKIQLVYLEILALSVTVNSLEKDDLRLPLNVRERDFSSADNILQFRTIGSALVYEEQANVLQNPRSYNLHNRVSHPMDNLFVRTDKNPFFDQAEAKYAIPNPKN